MNYINHVLEALDKLGDERMGYKFLHFQVGTRTLYAEVRHGKDDLRVYEYGGYQRYWPSVPSRDKRELGEQCRQQLRDWKRIQETLSRKSV